MKKVALFSKEDRQVLFGQTASKLNMNPSIVEKDFWVCFMLDHVCIKVGLCGDEEYDLW